MKKAKILIPIILIACFCLIFSSCKLFTVVKLDKGSGEDKGTAFYFEDNSFDADEYVKSIWDSKVVPNMEKESVDITVLVKSLKSNVDEAGKKYGFRGSDDGSAWNFIAKGRVKVVKVNMESRNGNIEVSTNPVDKGIKIMLAVGPVIRGTSIRDSLDFIKFDDFKNQMDYASLSSSFNKYVNQNIVNKLDFKNIGGKEIEFVGSFTFSDLEEVIITPIEVKTSGGGE